MEEIRKCPDMHQRRSGREHAVRVCEHQKQPLSIMCIKHALLVAFCAATVASQIGLGDAGQRTAQGRM